MAVDEKIDGRITRGQHNRELIIEAFMSLTREGNRSPTAQEVSERAGVGLRTVFRHFEDMETLYRELANEVIKIVEPLLQTPPQGETWKDKLQHAVQRRAGMFEQLMPIYLASTVHFHESKFLREQQAFNVQLQRNLLKAFLPKEVVADACLFESLDLILSIETWVRLRRDQGLNIREAADVVRRTILTLVKEL